jgi:hypothetical protein
MPFGAQNESLFSTSDVLQRKNIYQLMENTPNLNQE